MENSKDLFLLLESQIFTLAAMITYTTTENDADLEGILHLQRKNLKTAVPAHETAIEGFVSVSHNLENLRRLHEIEQHIIAKDTGEVVGYVLAMTKASRHELPLIYPLFEMFDEFEYSGKVISDYKYMLVGQVCIDKNYRGKGIFGNCYLKYKERYSNSYDFAITEIPKTNLRSQQAHKKIGFKEIHSYRDSDGVEWIVVLWDWNNRFSE